MTQGNVPIVSFVLSVVVKRGLKILAYAFAADGCARYAINRGVILELNVLELGQHIPFYVLKEPRRFAVGERFTLTILSFLTVTLTGVVPWYPLALQMVSVLIV